MTVKAKNEKRVVITGMGVVAPNGIGLDVFEESLRKGVSGITFNEDARAANLGCQVAGVPNVTESLKKAYFSQLMLKTLKSSGIMFGCIAGIDAWKDAGLNVLGRDEPPDWDSGTVFGSGVPGAEPIIHVGYTTDAGKARYLGGKIIQQGMSSGPSAYIGGMLGLGNQVTSNSSACSTGGEAINMAYHRIKQGFAKRMLAGSCEGYGVYIWAGFDSMRVLNRKFNDRPREASRPMSTSAAGFVPGSGAGALVLEDMETALNRGARIYAEVLGTAVNSGGHRQGGSMVAPNSEGVQRVIRAAVRNSSIKPGQIDAISGHLTGTMADPIEIKNWTTGLKRKGKDFPYINSLKSLIGHCIAAAGTIESIAVVLQLYKGFLHPSVNCEDLHPEITAYIDPSKVPQNTIIKKDLKIMAKASFGFGDVNTCTIFKKWE